MIEALVNESAAETLKAVSPRLAYVVELLIQAKQSPRQIAARSRGAGLSLDMARIVESAAHYYRAH